MLVGREHELGALTAHLHEMLAGRGHVLFLAGEAGLGKTTLVHNWIAKVMQQSDDGSPTGDVDDAFRMPQFVFSEADCSSPIGNADVGGLEALQPWADVIAHISEFGSQNLETRDSPLKPEINKSLAARPRVFNFKKLFRDAAPEWIRAVPVVGEIARAAMETAALIREQRAVSVRVDMKKLIHDAAPAWAWALPVVGEVAYAAIETSRALKPKQNTARAGNQEQVFQQYVNVIARVAEEHPLVIFLDDLHWADTSSTNLLRYLSRQISDKRILILGTYRHDDALTANEGKGHPILGVKNDILSSGAGEELALGHLTEESIATLMRSQFASYDSDARFEHWLHRISGGNALFVTQYLRTLQEDGLLDSAGAFCGEVERIAVPPSALAVVEERTRRLDPATRRMLTYATAEGEEFTGYVLERLAERTPESLLHDLTEIEKTGMVRSKGASRMYANQTTMIFGFSHALFHKALYDSLNDTERELLHHECYGILKAEWERLDDSDTRTPALAAKLLTHAEKSFAWGAVAEIALDAARNVWKSFAEAEALEMVARSLNALDRLGDPEAADRASLRGEAILLQARIDSLRGRYPLALQRCEEADRLLTLGGEPLRAALAMNGRIGALYYLGRYTEALDVGMTVLQRCEELDDADGIANACTSLGHVNLSLGNTDEAIKYHMRSRVMKERIGDRLGVSVAFNNLGIAFYTKNEFNAALAAHQESLAIKQSLDDRVGEAHSWHNIGNVHLSRGSYEEALPCYERALPVWNAVGDRTHSAGTLANIGNVYECIGNLDAALEYQTRCLHITEEIGDRAGESLALHNIGSVYRRRGDYEVALVYYGRSLTIEEETGGSKSQAITLNSIGLTHRLRGDLHAARAALERSLGLVKDVGLRETEATALCNLGMVDDAASARTDEVDRDHLRASALNLLERGVALLEEIQARDAPEFRAELERIRSGK